MEGIENVLKDLKSNFKKLSAFQDDILAKVREENPGKIDALIIDNKKVMEAIRNNDVNALNKLQKKYANNTNK